MRSTLRLIDVYKVFPNDYDCFLLLEALRWQGTVKCVYCNQIRVTKISNENRFRCNRCNTSFSTTTHTVFHHTHLPLQKWFFALWFILTSIRGISSRKLAEAMGVNKNTANYVIRRVDDALLIREQRELMNAIVTQIVNKTEEDICHGIK